MPQTAAADPILTLARIAVDAASLLAVLAAVLLVLREHGTRRWRRSLNAGLHELRRPLQVLALEPGVAGDGLGPLDLARSALADLDARVNGDRSPPDLPEPFAPRTRVAKAIATATARWQAAFAGSGREIAALNHANEDSSVAVDPTSLARILDNLVANALEHGSGSVSIGSTFRPGNRIAIAVTDDGQAKPAGIDRTGADARRGKGLSIVSELARRHGGCLECEFAVEGSAAIVVLPLPVRSDR